MVCVCAEHCTTKYKAHEFAIHTTSCYINLSTGGEALRTKTCDAVLLFLQSSLLRDASFITTKLDRHIC